MDVTLPRACAAQYRVERPIASGGYGATLLAVHRELDRPVALKVLHRDHLTDPEQVARFVQEAKVTAALDHPRIVRVYDHGIEDGVPWIAYEYVPGPTVRARMAGGALPWPEAVRVAIEVVAALEAAHDRGVIHRDVKPENVLTAEDGAAKLADFGIARWKRSAGVRTASGLVLGTPVYLSPEQCRGDEPSPASDLYALGVMLFEMSMGRPPFVDANPLALLRRHLEQPVPPLDDALPRALHGVVARALAKDPLERHRSARELRAELGALAGAGGDRTAAVPHAAPGSRRRTQKVPDRTRGARGLAAFEREAGATLDAAARPDHPAHVTAARLAAMPRSAVRPWHVRFFLALEANVNALFAGDGHTRRPDGSVGLTERVGANGPIAAAAPVARVALVP